VLGSVLPLAAAAFAALAFAAFAAGLPLPAAFPAAAEPTGQSTSVDSRAAAIDHGMMMERLGVMAGLSKREICLPVKHGSR
jgi:hypothetical protein